MILSVCAVSTEDVSFGRRYSSAILTRILTHLRREIARARERASERETDGISKKREHIQGVRE